MKLKADFVTNSSSASFTILKSNLTNDQIEMIRDHINIAKIIAEERGFLINSYDENKRSIYLDQWQINEDEQTINGYTTMDNFDMLWFLHCIGVKREVVDYDGET